MIIEWAKDHKPELICNIVNDKFIFLPFKIDYEFIGEYLHISVWRFVIIIQSSHYN